jgi:hypothetical protein
MKPSNLRFQRNYCKNSFKAGSKTGSFNNLPTKQKPRAECSHVIKLCRVHVWWIPLMMRCSVGQFITMMKVILKTSNLANCLEGVEPTQLDLLKEELNVRTVKPLFDKGEKLEKPF